MTEFGDTIAKGYASDGPAVELGKGMLEGQVDADALVRMPLGMLNRHGLIAGATGTGKTVTLQMISEQLSNAGVPVFVADMKGDLSGLSAAGAADGPAPKRSAELGVEYAPKACPVEFLSLGGIGPGVPVRATVSDFGPQLLAKILGANDTQEQSLSLVFRYADEKALPLLDLSDLRTLLAYLESDQGKAELTGLGGVSKATIGVLLRSLAMLEDGGGNELFGEPQFAITDLLRIAPDGRGIISSLELPAVQTKPQMFSTALMWMLAELFEELPEVGDLEKPKLVFFFDEAHLLFDGATKAFLDSVTQTVRMIRSKGVGVFFVTQMPKDIPPDVLGQLGNRIQHALRAFTPEDAKALKATASTFPTSPYYKVEELLTSLGTGEAAVTILSESGVPTPLVQTRLRAPMSHMGAVDDIDAQAKASPLFATYATRVDNQSAREMLAARLDPPAAKPAPAPPKQQGTAKPKQQPKPKAPAPSGGLDELGGFLNSRQGKAMQKQVVRGMFDLLKKKL